MRAPEPPAPRAVRATAALWWAGGAAGAFGLGAALVDLDALRARLTETATATDPTAAADVVDDGVRATVALVLGGTGLLTLLSLVWVGLLLRRRAWARWVLLGTALPLLFAIDVTQSVVAGGSDLDRIGLVAQAGLVVLALVPLLARSSRAWFRRRTG